MVAIEEFVLERQQSLWENLVECNLTESGIHPFTLRELLMPEEIDELLDLRLGYGWTNGDPALRDVIAAGYAETGPDEVLVTSGSAEANFLAMWTVLEPGDELVMMLPNYMQIWGLARSLGVEVRPFWLDADRAWSLDLDEVASLITERTRALVVCAPNNPTGAVLEPSEMRRLVEIADQADVLLYADEVYRGVELDGVDRPSFRDLSPRAVVTGGLSKALAHPGLRIGWLAGPADFIARAWHRNDYTTITTSLPSELVARVILQPERKRAILDRNLALLRHNVALLSEWLADQRDEFDLAPPRAGGMAFLKYRLDLGSTRISEFLRDTRSLLVVPGDAYGLDGYLRIGIGEESAKLRRGLELLADGFRELRETGLPD